MDVDEDESYVKNCYKCEESVINSLDVVYNSSNSKLVLWNKYQIFVYKDAEPDSLEKIFIPEFQIHLVIPFNNYLLCLDSNGNVHQTSLKFKSSTQKSQKFAFQPRDQAVKTSVRYQECHTLSIKYEADAYFLCLNRINTDFKLEKQIILLFDNEHWPLVQNSMDKYLLTTYSPDKENFHHLNKIFKIEDNNRNVYDLVLMSFDRLTIYACLFSQKMSEEETTLVKLYSCPAEICSTEFIDSEGLYLLIGLKMGTIIKLNLHDITKTADLLHMNTALDKMLALKNSIIYSDGTTMWKVENINTNKLKFLQIFPRNVKNFIKCGDQIICTTFSKLIYKFSIDDKNAYLIPKTNEEYFSAERLFNNSAYLNKLFVEIDKNNELVKRLEKEQDYITALALSKRQDVMNKAIDSQVTVFETYEEINENCILTEDIKEYFATNTWLFLITITNSNIFDAFNKILLNFTEHIQIFITLSTVCRILKTTCIKLREPLKSINFLLPLILTNTATEIHINIKIAMNIPGALDQKKSLTVLYRKNIVLNSELFIKTSQKPTVNSLKTSTKPLEDLISEINLIQYGSSFEFTKKTNLETCDNEWTFYVRLPNDYEPIFKTDYSKCESNIQKASKIMQHFRAEEFLKSKKHVTLSIADEKLNIKIQNDGFSNPLFIVTSRNPKIAFHVRNFFANVINKDCSYEPGKEFISYSFYTTTENIQKAVKECLKKTTYEEFLHLMDQFEKNIIGALPL